MEPNNPPSFWSDRRVFVTGCTGFLGSWLTRQLLDWNANVVGLVRDVPSTLSHLQGQNGRFPYLVQGRLENYDILLRALNEYEVDTVFHLGAQPIVGIANRNPVSTFEANIRGTWNLLEAARQISTVKRVVVASSDKAYGTQTELPYTETMPLQGRHPYDVSKSCTDLIAQTYHTTYGLPVSITRCGNFFGGGDLNFNRIIPGTIWSVLREENPVIRSDGTFIRDYIYVRDVVYGYLNLAQQMEDATVHGEAFNLSTGERYTVIDLVRLILKIMEREDLEPVIVNTAEGEIHDQYLGSEKARTILNWKPRFTMEQALAETIEWYRSHFRDRHS